MNIFLWVLLTCAIVLRFWQLDLMEFKSDEFLLVTSAIEHDLSLESAQASTHWTPVHHPFFAVFLLSSAAYISPDPVHLVFFVALVNLIGLVVLFAFVHRFIDKDLALPTVTLFASAPWAMIHARKIWIQDFIVPFAMITLYFLFESIRDPKTWKIAAFFTALAVFLQIHLTTWFVLPAIILFLLIIRPKWRPLHYTMGAGILIIFFLPYFFEHLSVGLPEKLMPDTGGTGSETGNIYIGIIRDFADRLYWLFSTVTGLQFDYLFADRMNGMVFLITFWIFALLAATATVHAIIRTVRRIKESNPVIVFFALNVLCVLFVYTLLNIPPYPHYFIVLYPAITIFVVLFAWRYKIGRLFLCGVMVMHLLFMGNVFHMLRTDPIEKEGDYGVPYFYFADEWRGFLEARSLPD